MAEKIKKEEKVAEPKKELEEPKIVEKKKSFFEKLFSKKEENKNDDPNKPKEKPKKQIKFKIPLTFASIDKLRSRSLRFKRLFKEKKGTKLQLLLESADVGLTREEYLSIQARSITLGIIGAYIFSAIVLFLAESKSFLLLALPVSLLFAFFTYSMQSYYPVVFNSRKQKNIEKNLIPALSDIYVQLNSGIPLFTILVNLSSADYGSLSEEFKKAVKKINAGMPEIQVLEDLGEKNSSVFFRRALWQISNGMRAGSDISVIIKESIRTLNEEQSMQIQRYGNKLNPLIMFYMLISVILPALSITFLTIISSLVGLPKQVATGMFIGLFVMVVIVQTTFLGLIKSMRPSLL